MANTMPTVVRDGDTTEYWEGIDRGELRLQQCVDCGRNIFYPRSVCPHCMSDRLRWITATGRGRIYSYTVVHRSFGPFADQAPFVVAIVELEEGVRMMTRIVGRREEVRIDAPVEVTFVQADEELTLPYFKLASARDASSETSADAHGKGVQS